MYAEELLPCVFHQHLDSGYCSHFLFSDLFLKEYYA